MDITFHGLTRDHKKWAKFLGVTESTLRWRLAHWGVERALTSAKEETKRRASRRKKLSEADKALICTAYIEGRSEDQIGGLLGVSRKTVGNLLDKRGLKIKGTSTKRTVKLDTSDCAHVHIHIHTKGD